MQNPELEQWAKLKVQLTVLKCAIRAAECVEEVRYQREYDAQHAAPSSVRSLDPGEGRQA